MKQSPVYTSDQIFVQDYDRRKRLDLKIEIIRIQFLREGFAILKCQIIESKPHVLFSQNQAIVKGNFINPRVGDEYWVSGHLEFSEKYGYSLQVNRGQLIYPRTRKEIINYITHSIKGLGVKSATLIADYFGENALETIRLQPEKLKQVPNLKLSAKSFDSIIDNLKLGPAIQQLMTLLTALKINEKYAFTLVEKYGLNAKERFKDNPYILADINPLLWHVCDRVFQEQLQDNEAHLAWYKYTSLNLRYRTAIKYYLKLALDMTGSLAVPEHQLLTDFESGEFLNGYGAFADHQNNHPQPEVIKRCLEDMVTEDSIVLAKDKAGNSYVYMAQSYHAEQQIIKLIKKFKRQTKQIASTQFVNQFISDYEKATGFKLAKKQRLAVDLLVNQKIAILTGGPGTGKTQTLLAVRELTQQLVKQKLIKDGHIAFLAPTGKAAQRMTDVLGVNAQTIHRKLKIGGFGRAEKPKTIAENFVVVDETSMIDVNLFAQLLSSLKPQAHLLLVGDENQLPSVGAGLILRDLIKSNKIKTVILDEVFRQKAGSRLVLNAQLMKDGIGIRKTGGLIFNRQPNCDSFFLPSASASYTKALMMKSVNRMITHYHYQLNDILILTAQNKGTIGTDTLNRLIQATYNPETKAPQLIRKRDNQIFRLHDMVMQLDNNYQQNVFNGEIGEITNLKTDDNNYSLVVTYPDHQTPVIYTGSDIDELQLAYAITVHKAQGSQAPVVIQLVDRSQSRMLNRSLIYTGYTRAEKLNIMIGQTEVLNSALKNTENLKRLSLIKDQL